MPYFLALLPKIVVVVSIFGSFKWLRDISQMIHLEARLPEQNIMRFFHILFGSNLFGDFQVTVTNGRIGAKGYGHRKHYIYTEQTSLYKKLRQLLRKRLNAQKRVGCAYVIAETDVDPQTLENILYAR